MLTPEQQQRIEENRRAALERLQARKRQKVAGTSPPSISQQPSPTTPATQHQPPTLDYQYHTPGKKGPSVFLSRAHQTAQAVEAKWVSAAKTAAPSYFSSSPAMATNMPSSKYFPPTAAKEGSAPPPEPTGALIKPSFAKSVNHAAPISGEQAGGGGGGGGGGAWGPSPSLSSPRQHPSFSTQPRVAATYPSQRPRAAVPMQPLTPEAQPASFHGSQQSSNPSSAPSQGRTLSSEELTRIQAIKALRHRQSKQGVFKHPFIDSRDVEWGPPHVTEADPEKRPEYQRQWKGPLQPYLKIGTTMTPLSRPLSYAHYNELRRVQPPIQAGALNVSVSCCSFALPSVGGNAGASEIERNHEAVLASEGKALG